MPRIDLERLREAQAEIADQLWDASTEIGFFQLVNHGIPQAQIDEAFEMTERFFALPHEAKAKMPLLKGTNAGWEYKSQVRPSTGTADNKESYQITLPRMAKLWPGGDNLPGFKIIMLGVRARQLGARHEGAVLLRAQARLHAGFLHRVPMIRCRRNIRARCGSCIICRWSMPSRKTSPAGAPARIPISTA